MLNIKYFGTSHCFVIGTLITMEDGQKPIEELFLGMYQGDGYVNTSGWSPKEESDFYGSRGGTYH